MYTQKLDEGSRIVAAISWRAIAAGVFVALALQSLLLVFGLAIGASVGDRTISSGFAWWNVAVQLVVLGIGGAIAARVSRATTSLAGMVAGAMVWAVAIVVTGSLGGAPLAGATIVQFGTSAAWAAFVGILLGLAAAVVGGLFGTRERAVIEPAPTQTPASQY